jgi:hypothetical protein
VINNALFEGFQVVVDCSPQGAGEEEGGRGCQGGQEKEEGRAISRD